MSLRLGNHPSEDRDVVFKTPSVTLCDTEASSVTSTGLVAALACC